MNNNYRMLKYQTRLNTLISRGDKNIKSGGVVRKLRRRILKLQGDNCNPYSK